MPRSSEEIFRSMIDEVWNQKRADAIEKYISPSYRGRNPDGDAEGPDGYRQIYDTYRSAFPDCRLKIMELRSHGDELSFHYVFEGTHDGELAGVEPTGESVSVHGMGMARVEEGKLAEDRVVWDTLSLMRQIGAA